MIKKCKFWTHYNFNSTFCSLIQKVYSCSQIFKIELEACLGKYRNNKYSFPYGEKTPNNVKFKSKVKGQQHKDIVLQISKAL